MPVTVGEYPNSQNTVRLEKEILLKILKTLVMVGLNLKEMAKL
ncbi:hypothetical protein JTS96_09410 [Clostridium botulinum]|nr:hypothetical protein [Clostridium botulinum]